MKIGDKVAYSVDWLRSTNMEHSHLARARGTILFIKEIGENKIATVDWGEDSKDVPLRVSTKNLALVGLNTRFSRC